ncbi:MAG: response regulator [Gemmatimonadales bacterium]
MSTTVLVVDDDLGIRRVLSRTLEHHGLAVRTAASGEEAFEVLSSTSIDLVLMDLRMPRMSGRTLYHMIRSQWPELADRVIVASGDPEAPEHREWIALYGLPVLTKPFDVADLLATISGRLPHPPHEATGS